MRKQKTIAAVALTAALAGGALFGATLGNPLASGAQDNPSTTTTTPKSSDQGGRPDGRGPRMGGGLDLEVAAKTLGLSTDELRTQLQSGKSLADIAKAEGVDKQKLIDALVAAGEKRLDEAKAELPDRIAEAIEATPGQGGFGHGGPGEGGPRGRGPALDVAAKALGMTVEDLQAQLQDGKTIAEVAKAKGVDVQKVIDALVADAKAKTAAAVKAGKLTQAEADQRLADITEHITSFVNDGPPAHGPGGHGPGKAPGDEGAGGSGTAPGNGQNGNGSTTTTPSFGGGN